jgi:hypothetical protein
MNKSDEGKKLIRDAKRSFTVVYFFCQRSEPSLPADPHRYPV